MSVNGIIARENYKEDFLSDYDWDVFCKMANKIGCFIVGRKTYDRITKFKDYNLSKIKRVKIIVISKKSFKDFKNFYFVKSAKEAVSKAKKLGFKLVLLGGGGNINSEFMKLSLINEMFFNIDPVILGKGIRVFKDLNFEKRLKLMGIKRLNGGIIQIHYCVK